MFSVLKKPEGSDLTKAMKRNRPVEPIQGTETVQEIIQETVQEQPKSYPEEYKTNYNNCMNALKRKNYDDSDDWNEAIKVCEISSREKTLDQLNPSRLNPSGGKYRKSKRSVKKIKRNRRSKKIIKKNKKSTRKQ